MTSHTTESKPTGTRRHRLSNAEAARQLGVTREHLSRVLHGHRESRSLTRRFAELRARYEAQQTQAPAAS